MAINRRDFLKTTGLSAVALINDKSNFNNLEKLIKYLAYTQQSEQSLYTLQKYNFNNFQFAEEPEIANRLTTQGIASDEFLQEFTGVNLGDGDYLIGSVLNGEGSFYKNETNSLEGRVNIHDDIKKLINAEPVRTRALGVKGKNKGDYLIVFDDKRIIHAVDLATNYVGDKTGTFYNIFEFVPIDMLSARVNNHSSPFHDNVLALKRKAKEWSIYWWQDVSASMDKKETAKPILEKFDLEGMFYNEDKGLGNVISLGIANLYEEQFDSMYAIRTPPLEGRIDDLQAARDIIEFNQRDVGASIIKRGGQPIPVFIGSSLVRRGDIDDAIKYWSSAIEKSFILIDKDKEPKILVRVNSDLIDVGWGGVVETYPNNRIRLGLIEVLPDIASHWSDPYRKLIYLHELGHAIGFIGHLSGGIMDPHGGVEASQREINFFRTLYSLPHGTKVYGDGSWKVILNPDGTQRATRYSQSTASINQKNSLQQLVSALHQSYPTSTKSYSRRDFFRG